MPYEKDVDESHSYWCPKWYWPFAICTRTNRVHKWCYRFRWVKETGYGFFTYWEGCEGETLYTWYTFCFLCFGGKYHRYDGILDFELCFNSPRSSSGRCAG